MKHRETEQDSGCKINKLTYFSMTIKFLLVSGARRIREYLVIFGVPTKFCKYEFTHIDANGALKATKQDKYDNISGSVGLNLFR